MTDQYLRIDAVNHAAVMDDTTQLSVIRGGSFLLREAVKHVAEKYSQSLKALSIEASTGLFQVLSGDAKGLRDQIASALSEHEQFRHFTFVVDVQSDESNLAKALASVAARNRFRQMRQLSVALPPWNEQAFAPCELDDRRPGDGVEWAEVSRSVEVRHNHGRTQKVITHWTHTARFQITTSWPPNQDKIGMVDGRGSKHYYEFDDSSFCRTTGSAFTR